MKTWVSYGQTLLAPSQSIDNPAPNLNGLGGEVTLPYTVPAGQQLVLTSWGIEGTPGGDSAIIPYVGTVFSQNSQGLPTCRTVDGVSQVNGMWVIPAGTTISARIVYAGGVQPIVFGWWIQGYRELV